MITKIIHIGNYVRNVKKYIEEICNYIVERILYSI